jgi:hypothetical protein
MGSEEIQNEVFILKKMISGSQTEYPIIEMQKIIEELN